jgi:hypothetical protein
MKVSDKQEEWSTGWIVEVPDSYQIEIGLDQLSQMTYIYEHIIKTGRVVYEH